MKLNPVYLWGGLTVALLFTGTYLYVKSLQADVKTLRAEVQEQEAKILLNEYFIDTTEALKSADQNQTSALTKAWEATKNETDTQTCDVPDSIKQLIDKLYEHEGNPNSVAK